VNSHDVPHSPKIQTFSKALIELDTQQQQQHLSAPTIPALAHMAEEEQQVNDADFEGLDEGMDNMGAEDGAAEGIDVSFANRTFCSAVGGTLVLNCISSMVACKLGYGHTVHALTACMSVSLRLYCRSWRP
jgi:hypothetical protein